MILILFTFTYILKFNRSNCNKIPTLIINKNSDSDHSKKNSEQQYFSKNAISS